MRDLVGLGCAVIVVDPAVRQRGIGGALYEALSDYLQRMGSTGLYLEVRPDSPELEPDAAKRRENRAQRLWRFEQRRDRGLPRRDVLDIAQRVAQPLPQQPCAHRRLRAIDRAEQRAIG